MGVRCLFCYLERSKREVGSLVSEWNLIVPAEVLERSWAAVP